MSYESPSTLGMDTCGLEIFGAGETACSTRYRDAHSEIIGLEGDWFIRPVIVRAPDELTLPEVIAEVNHQHERMASFGVTVVEHTYGFIETDAYRLLLATYDGRLRIQSHQMPAGLQIAARTRIIRPGDLQWFAPGEPVVETKRLADRYFQATQPGDWVLTEIERHDQYVQYGGRHGVYVDIDLGLTRKPNSMYRKRTKQLYL